MFTDFFSRFTTPALIGLILTASLLVITHDWRLSFVALGVQYALAALLIAQIVIWQVVVVKALVGLLVIGIFILTGRQVNYGPTSPTPLRLRALAQFEFPTGLPFRLLATVMAVVVAWYLASQPELTFPGLSLSLNLASAILITLGLLNLGLTEEPMNAGMGLLTGLMGFEIVYAAVEPSLAIIALLAAVNFGVALAVSYLALLRYPVPARAPEPEPAPESAP